MKQIDKNEDGTYTENPDNLVFSYKRKGTFKNKLGEKKENTAPRLFASNSHALTPEQTPSQIGRNSRVKMFFEPFAWQTGSGNKCGISSSSGASRSLSWKRTPLRSPLLRVVGSPPWRLKPRWKAR